MNTDSQITSSALDVKDAPGLFYFTVTGSDVSPSGSYNIHNQILKQTLILKEARVEFDTSAHSLACRELRFKFPWISIFHVVDNDTDKFHLRVPLENAAVTNKYGLDQQFEMSQNIHEAFDYLIFDSTGATTNLTGLKAVTLVFQFAKSRTT